MFWKPMINFPENTMILYKLGDDEVISGSYDGEFHHAFDGGVIDNPLGWVDMPQEIGAIPND